MLGKVDISLFIKNNTNYPQEINFLGSAYNALDTSNATTEYRWNFTTFSFTNEDSVSILYKAVGFSTLSSSTFLLPSQDIQGVVDALNTLGIGYFQSYTELGQTYISSYNDNVIFDNVEVFNSAAPTTTTTTTTTTAAPTTTTTTTTTTAAPTTTTTSTTTTVAPPPTTTTTSTTTTGVPTTTTTTTTTTVAPPPTTTTTSTTTTGIPTTTTTSTTTTVVPPPTTTTTSTTTTFFIYTWTVRADTSILTVCSQATQQVYTTSGVFGNGTVVYTDFGLTTPLAGFTFISEVMSGTIWDINNVNGTIGADTGSSCGVVPTTTTTSTTTTVAPTTTTTSTTTTAAFNLIFDWTLALSETVNSIDVNGITPTLIGGTGVPFNTDTHDYNTTQVGTNETININVTVGVGGQNITITDSNGAVQCQNVNVTGTYTFIGVAINNSNPVLIQGLDGVC